MRLGADELPRRLAQGLPRAILLFGDEPLLIEENAERVRQAAREQGFTDRIPLSVDSAFDWGRLTGSSRTLSLFAERRLIELRLPSGRPGDGGTEALDEYCASGDEDVCLMVIAGRLDARAKQAKWVKVLGAAGWAVEHRALSTPQFREWFQRRLAGKGLFVDGETADNLCYLLEGNLLAAAQEIDRISLFAGPDGRVDPEAASRGLVDNARFNAYAFTDACLAGDAAKALRVLTVLANEGTEPVLVVWALAKELRALVRIEHGLRQGEQKGRLFKANNIWPSRARMINAALGRLREPQLSRLTRQMARCDRVLKGRERGSVWHELDVIALMMCDIHHAAGESSELDAAG